MGWGCFKTFHLTINKSSVVFVKITDIISVNTVSSYVCQWADTSGHGIVTLSIWGGTVSAVSIDYTNNC